MRLSWRIGRIAGIGIYVHATYLLILAWIAIQEYVLGVRAVAGAMLYLFTLFSIVVLHELGHAHWAAHNENRYPVGLPPDVEDWRNAKPTKLARRDTP